jgi:hypothetical protein
LVLLGALGSAAGVWGGFFYEYQPSPRLRVIGAPVPMAFFHLEGPPSEEVWVDFVDEFPLLVAASNPVLLALLFASPVGLCFHIWCRRRNATSRADGAPGARGA